MNSMNPGDPENARTTKVADCAEFDFRLTALAAGDLAEERRADESGALREHAAECSPCRGAIALLDVLSGPPGERDLTEDPGDGYWDAFDARLAARIAGAAVDVAVDAGTVNAADPARHPEAGREGAGLRRLAAMVLVIVFSGSVGLWLLGLPGPDRTTDLTWMIARDLESSPPGAPLELPSDLAALIEALPPDDLDDTLAGLGGPVGDLTSGWLRGPWGAPDGQRGLTDALDEGPDDMESLGRLLAGLHDWEQVAALADWLPAPGLEPTAAEAWLPGAAGHGNDRTPFPDAGGLSAEARQEFLRWLTEQMARETDVS